MRLISLTAPLVFLAVPAFAQNPPAPPPPPTCDGPEYRQFDFWVGDWIVTRPDNGQQTGRSQVTRDLKNCVLTEHWFGQPSGDGSSFNIWDRRRRVWHQTWVSDTGGLLVMEGGLVGNRMVMIGGPVPGPNGSRVMNRMSWTPLDGGRVEQRWDTSIDSGTTWTTGFVGVYRHPS